MVVTKSFDSLGRRSLPPFEKLHRPLVLLCGRARTERAEIFSFAGSPIDLARVQPVLTRLELANHCLASRCAYADARR